MARTESDTERPRVYGNFRTPSSKGLAGMSSAGTLILLGGIVLAVFLVMFQLWIAAAVVVLVTLLLIAGSMVKDKHGRRIIERIMRRLAWWDTRYKGANLYRSGPVSRMPGGTTKLPGIAARSSVDEYRDSYGRPFALVRVPQKKHYTVVLGSEPDSGGMVDQDQVNRWVDRWSAFLGTLTDEPGLIAASVTIETAPDTGYRLARKVQDRTSENASPFAQKVLQETVGMLPSGSTITRAYVALTFKASTRANGKVRSMDEVAEDLAARLPNMTHALNGTGAGVAEPLTVQELCEVIRIAYDPHEASLFDQAYAAGQVPLLSWDEVGPQAHDAQWDHYRHNGVWSKSWAMSVPPRSTVQANIMQGLIGPMSDVVRKRVTMLYRPIDPARAAAIVEQDVNTVTFNASGRHHATSRDSRELQAAKATSEEEASGAGLLNYGLLVTASVEHQSRLADLEAAVDGLGASARIRLEQAYGAQDSTFQAALPLGVVIPEHLALPRYIRDSMG